MNATRKVKLKNITANLNCKLCMGYLVDATTIIECLHSFCKSCIVKYLEKSADLEEKYSPVCDVQLHSTKPLTSIRSDLMLQEIVYKLVPGLFKNEMKRRRKFYEESQSNPINQLDGGQVFNELYITSDDIIHLSLECVTNDVKLKESTRRYLKCPAAVSVSILKKFIHGKYDLPVDTIIDLLYGDRILPDDFLLQDIAYKYSWTYNGSKPLTLSYRIKGLAKKLKLKSELTINDATSKPIQDDVTTSTTKKKICNENGSNIMPTAPEEKDIKINTISFNGKGIISREIPIVPVKTPSGKVRGRKRKHLNYSNIVIENPEDVKRLAKRLKLPKQVNAMVQSSTQVEIDIASKDTFDKEINEVQLQISEDGVISARSGMEKIILNMEASFATTSTTTNSISNPSPTTSLNLAEKLLLSGNFHSKTGPNGVTEITCDKPDQTSGSLKTSTAKPGYVTLNIPNPNNTLLSQPSFRCRSIYTDCDQLRKEEESPGHLIPNAKISPTKKSNKIKMSTREKIKNQIAAKGKDGENMIKAITDLGKLSKGIGSYNNAISNTETQSMPQKSPGVHSLPMVATLNNNSLHKQIRSNSNASNGTNSNCASSQIPLPFALKFSPLSGMSVSMIPCTATSTSTCTTPTASTTPPKSVPHQTTVVNGDLKFTTSPKHQRPNGGKPPKFFKSRHTVSPVSLNQQKQSDSSSKQEFDMKRKTPPPNGNGLEEPSQKKVKEQSKGSDHMNVNIMPSLALGSQPSITSISQVENLNGMMNGISTDKYSQHLSALSSLAGNSSESLSSKLGIALDATNGLPNGNGRPLGMVVTDSYCSMPFLNQRHPIPFGFGYPGLVTNANVLPVTFPKTTVRKSDASNIERLNLQSSNCSPALEIKNGSTSGDHNVTKSNNNNAEVKQSPRKESSIISVLANLLNPKRSERNSDSNKQEKSKMPVNKIMNGGHHSKSPSPTLSKSSRPESNNTDGRDMMDEIKPASSNGNKDIVSSFSEISHGVISHKLKMGTASKTENSKSGDKKWIRNGSAEHVGNTSPSADAKLSLTAQNNNNPTVSNSYDSADSTNKVPENANCAKITNGNSVANASSCLNAPGSKCGSA